jgi:lipid-A-disaccharide synthase
MLYGAATAALATPGTVTLELALSGTPLVVATRPDFLTYVLGSLLVRTKIFAMPNLLMGKKLVPEYIGLNCRCMQPKILHALKQLDPAQSRQLSVDLAERLEKGCTPDYFVSNLING